MEKYKITSTSAHSSKIVDPIEIETTGNTRKVDMQQKAGRGLAYTMPTEGLPPSYLQL